jgi:hypothetical protein
VDATYDRFAGDAIPDVPPTWNPDAPTPEDLSTDYGALFVLLTTESDPADPSSLVSRMNDGAALIGIPRLP